MNAESAASFLAFTRRKTIELLDKIAAEPDPLAVLAWQPGPGRANIAWQLMHIAAIDDRHLNVRMRGGVPVAPELVERYGAGSKPDATIPTVEQIRAYLTERREAMLQHLMTLKDEDFATKPNEQAPWTYAEWFPLLNWHEAHHQGQAHLTYNLFKALPA